MMAKTKHRILATLLAAALIVGMLPASALAAEGAGSVIELTVGESYAIPNAAGSALEDLWWSDNESIAAVEDGVVTGVSAGETTVHHTYYEAVYEKVEVPAAPVETTPAETVTPIPEETAPVEELPEETAPVEELPEETTPVEELPEETTPVEELPEETAPVEELPEETAPVEELPEETAPVEELPEETAPVEELPEETAPVEELPEETAPVEEIPEESAPVEETPEESAPAGNEAGPDSAANSTGELAASAVGAALLRGIGSAAGSLTLSHGVSTADGSSALPVSPAGEGEPAPEEGPAPAEEISVTYVERTESWTVVVINAGGISGQESYQGVTVYVDAPTGAFPEGTELKIRPVVQEAAPLSLFSTLAGTEPAAASAAEVETAVAEAMEAEPEEPLNMVAFDITFVDAEGNELQPAGGQTVSVRFEVEASSGLVSEETGALQVFHVETDGDKNVTSAQPVGDAVAVEDASAGQTVAVEADSFSIYVVAGQGSYESLGNLDGKTFTGSQTIHLRSSEGNNFNDHRWSITAGSDAAAISESGRTATLTLSEVTEETAVTVEHSWVGFYDSGSETATITLLPAMTGEIPVEVTIYHKDITTKLDLPGVEPTVVTLYVDAFHPGEGETYATLLAEYLEGQQVIVDGYGYYGNSMQDHQSDPVADQDALTPEQVNERWTEWAANPDAETGRTMRVSLYYYEETVELPTTFFDYVVLNDNWNWNSQFREKVRTYGNINDDDNYSDRSRDSERLGIGQGNTYHDYGNATLNGKDVNQHTERDPIVPGIVTGLDDSDGDGWYEDVNYGLYAPDLFSAKDYTSGVTGKVVYDDYSLTFQREGDKYVFDETNEDAVVGGAGGSQTFTTGRFFPLDDEDSAQLTENNGNNGYFGMRFDATFTIPQDYEGDTSFLFEGDDDLWVFVDGYPVIDLGGIHYPYPLGNWDYYNSVSDRLNGFAFSNKGYGDSYFRQHPYQIDFKELGYDDGEEHTITILYMERGGYDSHCHMEMVLPNLVPADNVITAKPKSQVQVTKTVEGLESLTGYSATFDIYADTNGNGSLDSGDTRVDTVTANRFGGSNTKTVSFDYKLGAGTYFMVERLSTVDDHRLSNVTDGSSSIMDNTYGTGYYQQFTVVEGGARVALSFVNSYEASTQTLVFTKTWAGGEAPQDSITVQLSNGTYTYSGAVIDQASGWISQQDRVWYTRSIDGQSGVWTITVTGLPAGAAFTVAETAVNGTDFSGDKANVDADGDGINEGYWTKSNDGNNITNTYTQNTGSLTVGKTVSKKYEVSEAIPTGEEFSITVTFGNGTGGAQTGSTYEPNGVYSLSLANDEEVTITGIPYGTSYTVTEALTDAQTQNGYSYKEGQVTSPAKIDSASETVTIQNEYYKSPKTSIDGTKTWSGEGAPDGAVATITLTGKVGNETVVTRTDTVSVSDPTYSFTGLDQYNAYGQQITYTVAETGVSVNQVAASNVDGKFVVYDTSVPTQDQTGVHKYKVVGYWESAQSGYDFTNTWVPAGNEYSGEYGFTVQKVDENDAVIDGSTEATFVLTKPDGSTQTYTTTDGVVRIGGLEAGQYKLSEQTAPQGYVKTTTEWTITITQEGQLLKVEEKNNILTNIWNWIFGKQAETVDGYSWNASTDTLSVKNTQIKGTIQVTKEIPDGLTASGSFTFDVKDSTGTTVDTLTMAAGGSATTKELPYGDYTIEETGTAAITDYTWSGVTYSVADSNPDDKSVTVSIDEQGETIAVTAANAYTRDTGTLEITKRIPAGDWSAVTGAESYSGVISYSGAVESSVTFDETGFERSGSYYVKTWTIDDVPTGSYAIAETGAGIAHYDLSTAIDKESVTVEKGETASVIVTNDYTIHTHDLSIGKIVAKTDTSVDAPEEDFTFTVKLDSGSVTVPDEKYTGNSASYMENGSYTFTLDNGGTAVITGVPYDVSYEVEEINIPEGFLSSWTDNKAAGTIGDAGNVTLTCTNTYFKSPEIDITVNKTWSGGEGYRGEVTVELYKDGAATGETVALNEAKGWSASFDNLPLYDGRDDAEKNVYSVRETAVSGAELENGRFIVWGSHENQGDSRDAYPYDVTGVWTAGYSASEVDSDSTVTITNTWTPAYNMGEGAFTVKKVDADNGDAVMPDVTFTLKAKEITEKNADGTPKAYADNVQSTNASGEITFDSLPAGTYELTETKVDGYSEAGPWTITVGVESGTGKNTLTDVEGPESGNIFTNIWNWLVGAQGIVVENGVLTVENTRIDGGNGDQEDTITITKVDGEDNSKLSGAEFTLYQNGSPIGGPFTTDGNGQIAIVFGDDGIAQGDNETVTYTLKETTPPAGYAETDEEWTITVTTTTEDRVIDGKWVAFTTYEAAVTDADSDDAKTIANDKVTGAVYGDDAITINKADQNGAAVPGAEFALYQADGTTLVKGGIVTDENGRLVLTFGHEADDIQPGTNPDEAVATGYVLKEVKAPTGFTKGETAEWDVTVTVTPHEALTDTDEDGKGDTWVTTYTYDAVIEGDSDGDDILSVINTRNSYGVTVTKSFSGVEALPGGFQINYSSDADTAAGTLTLQTDGVTGTGTAADPYTWTVELPYGKTFTFSETGRDVTGYEVTTEVDGEPGTSGTLTVGTGSNKIAFENEYEQKLNEDADVINGTSLTIQKIGAFDGESKPLNGVEFTLTNGSGTIVDRGTTSADGILKLNINSGYLGKDTENGYDFTLTESENRGYISDGPWTVHVGPDGEVLVSEEPNDAGFFYNIYNWIVEKVTGKSGAELTVGETDEGAPMVTITNTREEGKLTVRKDVTGIAAQDTDAKEAVNGMEYTFRIQAGSDTSSDVEGKSFATSGSGTVTFQNGMADVKVKNDGSLTIEGLPTGSYTVTEITSGAGLEDYHYSGPNVTINGDPGETEAVWVGKNAEITANVVNSYEPVNPQAGLTIVKNIQGQLNGGTPYGLNVPGGETRTYYFEIEGSDVYGKPYSDTVEVVAEAGTSSVSKNVTVPYGVYTVTEVDGSGAPIGAAAAAQFDGYTWSSVSYQEDHTDFTLGQDGYTVTATNLYTRNTQALSVQKIVNPDISYGLPAEVEGKEYTFTIKANGVDAVEGAYTATVNGQELENGLEFNENGVAVVKLKKDDTLRIPYLPTGSYTVTEDAASARIDAEQTDWTWTPVEDQTADLAAGTENLVFYNTYTRNTGSLTITKQVEGAGAGLAKNKTYTFIITAPENLNGAYQTSVSGVTASFNGGKTAEVSVTLNGETTGSITVYDLPTGTYSVAEKELGDHEVPNYVLSTTGGGNVTVTTGDTAASTVTNTYSIPDEKPTQVLTVEKRVEGLSGTEAAGKSYTFQISGTDIYGAELPSDKQSVTVTIGAGSSTGSSTIELPKGSYTVTEVTDDLNTSNSIAGYTWEKVYFGGNEGETSAIVDMTGQDRRVVAVNVYDRDLGDLTVTKVFKNLSEAEVARLNGFKLTVKGPADYAGDTELTLDEAVKDTAAKHPTYTWTLEKVPTGDYTVSENRKDFKLAEYSMTVKGAVGENGLALIPRDQNDNFELSVTMEGDGDTASVLFQNAYRRQTGSLTIAKTSNHAGEYTFGIYTRTGEAGAYTYAQVGGDVTVKNGETSQAITLDTGVYYVVERNAGEKYYNLKTTYTVDGAETALEDGYLPVTVSNNTTAAVACDNDYSPVPEGDISAQLTITKHVREAGASGLLGGVTDGKIYYFQVTGTTVHGNTVDRIIPVTVQDGAGNAAVTLTYGTYTVTELEADVAGTAADESLPDIDGYAWQGVTYDGAKQITLNESNTAASVTATNTYEAEAIVIPVLKRWNGDGSRPSSITVELYKDGAATGETQVLTASGNWQGEFTEIGGAPLYKYENGKAVSYSVRETKFGSATVYGNVYGYWSISTGATTAEAAGLWSGEAGAENAYEADDLVLVVTNSYYVPDPGDGDGGDDDDPPTPPTDPEDPEEPVEIPEDPTPLDPGPGEEPVEIPEDPTPLDPGPEEEVTIDEDGVPLGDLPQTGAVAEAVNPAVTLGLVAISLSLAALGLQITITRKKEEEEY